MAGGNRYVPPYRVGYVDVKSMAEAWGMSTQAVRRACRAGRIPGALLIPHPAGPNREAWVIPFDAVRPDVRR